MDPTQPNPWVNPTHGQLCRSLFGTAAFRTETDIVNQPSGANYCDERVCVCVSLCVCVCLAAIISSELHFFKVKSLGRWKQREVPLFVVEPEFSYDTVQDR